MVKTASAPSGVSSNVTPPASAARTALALVGEAGDEAEIVARIRAGDVEVFEALFRGYHVALRRFAEGYTDSPESAEEIVQDVFLRVWEQRARWRVATSVRSYLFGAVRNGAYNVLKHRRVVARVAAGIADRAGIVTPGGEADDELVRRRGPLDASLIPGFGSGVGSADGALRTRELAHALRRAVAALPERCRQAYTLRVHYDLSPREIADVMGISLKGVEVQLTRAVKALQVSVGEQW